MSDQVQKVIARCLFVLNKPIALEVSISSAVKDVTTTLDMALVEEVIKRFEADENYIVRRGYPNGDAMVSKSVFYQKEDELTNLQKENLRLSNDALNYENSIRELTEESRQLQNKANKLQITYGIALTVAGWVLGFLTAWLFKN